MSEQTTEKKPVASIGKVERVNLVNQIPTPAGGAADKPTDDNELTDDKKKANLAAGLNEDGSPKTTDLTEDQKKANLANGLNEDGSPKTTELTEDQKKENIAKGLNEDGTPKTAVLDDAAVLAYLKSKGKDVNSLDEITKPTKELTPEEKKQAEDALDKKRLDWFVAHGGTVDSYAAMKIVATSDLTELSEKELEAELKAAGFTEEEKKMIRAERYYQLEEEEIESLTDEKEKELARKKRDFGTKKLNGKAAHKQKLAVGFFENIDKALKAEADEADAEIADENELAQKVDSHFKTIPGKITLKMGETTDKVAIPDLELDADVIAPIIAEVHDLLKTTDKRKQLLYNQDDSLNIAALSEILIRNKVLEAAVNRSYLKGVSDNTAEFEKTFPIRDRNSLGITHQNGNNGKAKGKIASFGKVQRVQAGTSAT